MLTGQTGFVQDLSAIVTADFYSLSDENCDKNLKVSQSIKFQNKFNQDSNRESRNKIKIHSRWQAKCMQLIKILRAIYLRQPMARQSRYAFFKLKRFFYYQNSHDYLLEKLRGRWNWAITRLKFLKVVKSLNLSTVLNIHLTHYIYELHLKLISGLV